MSLPTGNRLNLLSYLQTLVNACNERMQAWQLATITPLAVPATGDRVDNIIRECQHAMSDNDVYVNPTIEIDGLTPAAVDATDYTLRTYCGLSTSPYVTAGVLANSTLNWRRKKPRTVTNLSGSGSGMDTDNNASATGMRAYYNPSGTTDLYIVKYNGTLWQQCWDGMPDLLDSNNSSPNGCLPGVMQTGDYMGIHLYDELSKVINAASVCFNIVPFSVSGLPSPAYTYTRYSEQGNGSDPSTAVACAQAVSTFSNVSGSPAIGFGYARFGGGTTYQLGSPAIPSALATYVAFTGGTTSAETAKFWMNAIEYCSVDGTTGVGTGYPQAHTSRFYSGPDLGTYASGFNAQTDPVSQTTYTKFGTDSVAAGTPAQEQWSSGTAPSDFSPTGVFGGGTTGQGGYNCPLYYVVSFTGFTYTV